MKIVKQILSWFGLTTLKNEKKCMIQALGVMDHAEKKMIHASKMPIYISTQIIDKNSTAFKTKLNDLYNDKIVRFFLEDLRLDMGRRMGLDKKRSTECWLGIVQGIELVQEQLFIANNQLSNETLTREIEYQGATNAG